MKAALRVLITLLLFGAGCYGARTLWDYYMYSPWTRDARIDADVVSIAPDVAGFVRDLRVKDDQFVHKGDVLFVLDQDRYKLALATAEQTVGARLAQMQMAQHVAERRARLTTLSTSEEERQNTAFTANAAVAAYGQAVADLATARLNLDRTVVYAPVNGYVTNLTLDVGQYASVGTRLLALIDSDSFRVEGYFEETKMPLLKPGLPVDIHLMSGGPRLMGHIESMSRGITNTDGGNGPELLANVNPTFEWVRLAQRIPVRIHIDEVPQGMLISAGMTCTVVVAVPESPGILSRAVQEVVGGATSQPIHRIDTAQRTGTVAGSLQRPR